MRARHSSKRHYDDVRPARSPFNHSSPASFPQSRYCEYFSSLSPETLPIDFDTCLSDDTYTTASTRGSPARPGSRSGLVRRCRPGQFRSNFQLQPRLNAIGANVPVALLIKWGIDGRRLVLLVLVPVPFSFI